MSCNHSEAVCVIGNFWTCPICDEQKSSPESSEWIQMWTSRAGMESLESIQSITHDQHDCRGDLVYNECEYYDLPVMIRRSILKNMQSSPGDPDFKFHKIWKLDIGSDDWKPCSHEIDEWIKLWSSKEEVTPGFIMNTTINRPMYRYPVTVKKSVVTDVSIGAGGNNILTAGEYVVKRGHFLRHDEHFKGHGSPPN